MDSNLKKDMFRPQQFNPRFKLKRPYRVGRYNWIPYFPWSLKNYLHYVHSVLHYKSSHSPEPIQRKWKMTYKRFERKHQKII